MIQFRPLEPRDLNKLAQLYGYYAKNTVFTYYAQMATPSYMDSLLHGPGHACSVAEQDGGLVGYVHISPSSSIFHSRAEIAAYLLPEYTGQGLGKAFVEEGERLARALGYTTMIAAVCTENERSMALFDSLGYNRQNLRKNAAYKFERMLDTQYFSKEL